MDLLIAMEPQHALPIVQGISGIATAAMAFMTYRSLKEAEKDRKRGRVADHVRYVIHPLIDILNEKRTVKEE